MPRPSRPTANGVDGPSLTPETSALREHSFWTLHPHRTENCLTVKLTIHRGAATVGGSCIEIATGHTSQTRVLVPGSNSDPRVFFPELFVKSARHQGIIEKPEGLFNKSRIETQEILADSSRLLMVFRPSLMADFQDKMPPETLCISSRWPGYLERPEWKELQNPAMKNPLHVVTLHTSGHMLPTDVVRFVKAMAPRTVVPIHTFEPEEFRRRFENAHLLKDGETFAVA